MKNWLHCSKSFPLLLALSAAVALEGLQAAGPKLAPLPLKLPVPAFMGTPVDLPTGKRIEKHSDIPRKPFMAPVGVKNVALGKKVTSSDNNPVTGDLKMVTDGNKESGDETYVELHKGTQWVQIDLGKPYKIYAIIVWHCANSWQVYHGVVVQVSDDPDFTKGVKTVYNNDMDNMDGLGIGTSKEYFEDYQGKLINTKGVEARYVRCYSHGSTYSALNRYTEVEVWGLPAK